MGNTHRTGEASGGNEAESADTPLDLVASLAGSSSQTEPRGTFVGECLDARHPVLTGRILVAWVNARGERNERWVPSLHGLVFRVGDRVLLDHPMNFAEPIATGVIDGFANRPPTPKCEVGSIALQADEAIRVTTAEGEPLLELSQSESGPVVRLLRPDVDVRVEGTLRLGAKAIELSAREGEVKIAATADVRIEGENIHLN